MKFNIPVWIYIIGAIWAILVFAWIIYVINKKKAKTRCSEIVDQIKVEINEINKIKVVSKYNSLETYKVTNSLNKFINEDITPNLIKYKQTYQNLNKDYQRVLVKFEENRVFKLESSLEKCRLEFKQLRINAQKIAKNINYVFEEERDNREIVEILKIKLNAFDKTYLSDESIFYYTTLSKKYYSLEEKYQTIENDNNVEYDYLVHISKVIYDEIKLLEDCVLTYPKIYNDANLLFKKLGELNELYENLIEQKYNLEEIKFENKYELFIVSLEKLIFALTNLEEIDNSVLNQAQKFIDDCYLRFEDEISAKENLNQKYGLYEKNCAILEKLANEFDVEMKEISKYDIKQETKDQVGDISNKIDLYLDRYKHLVDFLSDSKIDYYRANKEAIDINNNVEKLIKNATHLIEVSKKTRKDEINAKKEYMHLQNVINDGIIASLTSKINLENFTKNFVQSRVILKRLDSELTNKQIKIEDVNSVLNNAIEIVGDLKILIEKQIILKKIAKNTLIYANRYRNSHENNLALVMCERLIKQGLYKKSIENTFVVISRSENISSINEFIYTWEKRV